MVDKHLKKYPDVIYVVLRTHYVKKIFFMVKHKGEISFYIFGLTKYWTIANHHHYKKILA